MLSGPSHIPQNATSAVILCHGYGANGNDLMDLALYFKRDFPSTAFFCPNAPESLPFGGYQWFSLDDFNPNDTVSLSYADTLVKRSLESVKRVTEFRHFIQKTYHIDDNKIILGGFSQGGLIAQISALTDESPSAGILAFSSVPLVFDKSLPLSKIKQKLPILLTHGGLDDVIPIRAQSLAQQQLESAKQTPVLHTSPFMGHGIDESCLNAALEFLKKIHF